jgi:hypothetical protein
MNPLPGQFALHGVDPLIFPCMVAVSAAVILAAASVAATWPDTTEHSDPASTE